MRDAAGSVRVLLLDGLCLDICELVCLAFARHGCVGRPPKLTEDRRHRPSVVSSGDPGHKSRDQLDPECSLLSDNESNLACASPVAAASVSPTPAPFSVQKGPVHFLHTLGLCTSIVCSDRTGLSISVDNARSTFKSVVKHSSGAL